MLSLYNINMGKQTGGVTLKPNYNSESAFNYFLNNSIIDVLPGTIKSASGVIFSCKLNDSIVSPYIVSRRSDFGKDVREIIIKLVAVDSVESATKKTWSGESFSPIQKYIENKSSFNKEISIQKEVFEKTIADPACPAIMYSDIKNKNDAIAFLSINNFSTATKDTTNIIGDFKKHILDNTIPLLGIIGMEIADGYITLRNLYESKIDEETIRRFENMARLRILDMTIKTGYNQNDFNVDNVLINPHAIGYYVDIPGHVIIIDFGLALPITSEQNNILTDLSNEKNYIEALTFIGNLTPQLTFISIYGWLYFRYDKYKNKAKKQATKVEQDRLNDVKESEIQAPISLRSSMDGKIQILSKKKVKKRGGYSSRRSRRSMSR